MPEDAFVSLLLTAGHGQVREERDLELARAAGRWAIRSRRWQPYGRDGFVVGRPILQFQVCYDETEDEIQVRARLQSGYWHDHVRFRVEHLGHGLNQLASEELIPGGFCPIASQARDDHAEVLLRSAEKLTTGIPALDEAERVLRAEYVAALIDAAGSARELPGIAGLAAR